MPNRFEPPKETTGDAGFVAMRAALQLVPGVGSAAVELLSGFLESPIEARKNAFLNDLAGGLYDLSIRLEALEDAHREQVIDAILQATQSAMRTSREEKRSALRNAVLNTALRTTPDGVREPIFLALIDRLTPVHLQMLDLFSEPVSYLRARNLESHPALADYSANLMRLILLVFPELDRQGDLPRLVWKDLSDALLVPPSDPTASSQGQLLHPRITYLGRAFLEFIRDPRAPRPATEG